MVDQELKFEDEIPALFLQVSMTQAKKLIRFMKLKNEFWIYSHLGVLLSFFIGIAVVMAVIIIPATIGEWTVWESDGFDNTMAIIIAILYVIIRVAIIAVKILVPYFIVRYIIRRFNLSRALYLLVAVIGIIALVTDGSSYRKYRKEHPEFVESIVVPVDEDANAAGRIIAKLVSYEGGRMVYDFDRLSAKMNRD